MALLDFGAPPTLEVKGHRDYLPWLEHRCYDRACAYCLENARVLEVDHVEPESFAPERAKDPTNLLPACGTCNGPTGKWDYHPKRSSRKKRPDAVHGYSTLDPRTDDLASLYEVGSDGTLLVRPGVGQDRALWNRDILFRLNRKNLREWRMQTASLATLAEYFVEAVKRQGTEATLDAVHRRDVIVREIAQRLLFFEILEVPLSQDLRAQAEKMRDSLRGPPPR